MISATKEPASTRLREKGSPDNHGESDAPISIYEVHPGSWMRVPEENNRPLTPAEIAPKLADYVERLDFTHVELLLKPETPAFRPPQNMMPLIRHLHQRGIGVILDPGSVPFVSEGKVDGDSAYRAVKKYDADGIRAGDSAIMPGGDSHLTLNWDAAWRDNLLDYFARDPIYRKYHHPVLSSRPVQPENCILPFSHEAVVPGKGSLLGRMPGDDWQKFANLRLVFAFMYLQPGKKLVFMGGEFGQWNEWNADASLDWHLVRDHGRHQALQHWVADLNRLYRCESALHQAGGENFEWLETADAETSTISWLRKSVTGDTVLAVCNCTPVPRHNYRVGVPTGGQWTELLNSDAREYGGSGQGNLGGVEASPFGWNYQSHSLTITLPPLGAVLFQRINEDDPDE